MKNVINYFYNLVPDNIHQNKEEYFFEVNNIKYIFQECNRTIEELYELYSLEYELYQRNIYLHQLVLNINNEIITNANERKYVLMRVFYDENKKISFNDILKITGIKVIDNFKHIKRNNWRGLWIDKIDYLEYQIEQNKNKYYIFSLNIDYFIGLTETAIQLLDGYKKSDLYLSHLRINSNMKVRELYNPLNIVLDHRIRDISEYFKDALLKKDNIDIEIFNYLETNNNKEELFLFFIRFIYMTKYFDLFDRVLLNNDTIRLEEEMENIIVMIELYEKIIKKLYAYLYRNGVLPEIEWLKKISYENLS